MQRMILRRMLHQNFGVAADHHQKIIEVVRDPSSQTPHRLHFLRLTKLILQHPALSHVLGNHFYGFARLPLHRSPAQAYRDGFSILTFPPHFHIVEARSTAKLNHHPGLLFRIHKDVNLRIQPQHLFR